MYARILFYSLIHLSVVYVINCTLMEVSVELIRYDTNWDNCGFFDGKCDPKFEVCINGVCKKTSSIDNTNHIDFKNQTVTPNPIIFTRLGVTGEMNINITVIDQNLIAEKQLLTLKMRTTVYQTDRVYTLTGSTSTRLQFAIHRKCKSGSIWTPCTRNVNECDNNQTLCNNNSHCVQQMIGYDCVCNEGFTGSDCQSNIDDCVNNTCKQNATCVDRINGYDCVCPLNYTGTHCETKISMCDSDPCGTHGRCNDTDDGYECHCLFGYTGSTCVVKVDNCHSNPCKNSADCINQITSYDCLCLPGYSGKNCETLLDVCLDQPCLNRGICMARGMTYECFCAQGYYGKRCENNLVDVINQNVGETISTSITTFDVNTPNTLISNSDYSDSYKHELTYADLQTSHANIYLTNIKSAEVLALTKYHNTFHSFVDISPSISYRFSQNDVSSLTFIEGLHHSGQALKLSSINAAPFERGSDIFIQTTNSRHFAPDSSLVEKDANQFATNIYATQDPPPHVVNYFNTIEIKSSDTYNMHQSTEIPTTSAIQSLHQCVNGGILMGSQCICMKGFTGIVCETDIDDCHSNPCKEHGTCLDYVDGFKCLCPQGFTGTTCHIPIDECLNGGTETKHAHGYVCRCATGYEGIKCEIKLDHCTSGPCKNGATCTTVTNGYQCKCTHGYDGPHCEILTDSCVSEPCQNSGTCLEHTHGYTCKCAHGYEGQYCERFVNYCQPNPCLNGSTCKLRHHGYRCHCQTGFYGNNCDLHN